MAQARSRHRLRRDPLRATLGTSPPASCTGAVAPDIAHAATTQMQRATFSIWLLAGGIMVGGIGGDAARRVIGSS